jgi:hypothetical protein
MQRFIAIGSTARSGKDSLANLLVTNLEKRGFWAVKYSLAFPLKQECDDFLKSQFNISAFTENNEEKEMIRPILVGVGSIHRKLSQGQYFTTKLDERVKGQKTRPDFVIVPDLRYATYPNDELQWFKKHNSYIVDVGRFDKNGELVGPANQDEEVNSQIINQAATEVLLWKTYGNKVTDEMQEIANAMTENILSHFNLVPA